MSVVIIESPLNTLILDVNLVSGLSHAVGQSMGAMQGRHAAEKMNAGGFSLLIVFQSSNSMGNMSFGQSIVCFF
ncbi:MAG: hypothetical protein M0Q95_08015 [Porticoccaceae bacterium]|nr:hypothetical protein [Porticoccaceae bacterium]